ncbi:MAG: hypothetical protein JW793_13180 [Acidobacteria bacterium]|nr:hypothetical protein [Acidobacteriota bacterium]
MIILGSHPSIPDMDRGPDRIALLLAGGDGTRLNDLTREISGSPIPKQYCRLYCNTSLLEATLARTRLFTRKESIHIIINRNHLQLAAGQVSELPEANILVQPANRDTGPGILFSLLELNRTHPDAVVAVFPTDHYIDKDRAFIAHAFRAVQIVKRMPDKIVILGVSPDRPGAGYGYLMPGGPVGNYRKTYHVKTFVEKPSVPKACEIMALGGLWNTFVMVFKLSRMLDILKRLVPGSYQTMLRLARLPHVSPETYQKMDAWNFSSRVLTRIPQHIVMLEVDDVSWSDWGTRESIERTYKILKQVPFWELPPYRPEISRKESRDQTHISRFIA